MSFSGEHFVSLNYSGHEKGFPQGCEGILFDALYSWAALEAISELNGFKGDGIVFRGLVRGHFCIFILNLHKFFSDDSKNSARKCWEMISLNSARMGKEDEYFDKLFGTSMAKTDVLKLLDQTRNGYVAHNNRSMTNIDLSKFYPAIKCACRLWYLLNNHFVNEIMQGDCSSPPLISDFDFVKRDLEKIISNEEYPLLEKRWEECQKIAYDWSREAISAVPY